MSKTQPAVEAAAEHERILAIIQQKNDAPIALDPSRTALVIIDVQRYFVRPEEAFGQVFDRLSPGVTSGYFHRVHTRVLPNIQRLQSAFRARGMRVMYTATGTRTGDGQDLPGWLRELDHLGLAVLGERIWPPEGDPRWQVDDSIAPRPGEVVFAKCSSGPLASTRMDQMLRHLGIDTVVVTGLTTDVCTTQTARELADRGFTVILAEDATTTLSARMHESAVQCFNIAFGRVRSTDQLLAMLTPAESPPALAMADR
ncbi:MAG TPA: isochorismatase family cysteine hydrolase [Gemmatimonadaceae bacterium]|nr:isochorismatase family cysteine hydrolase [Gemmatimonadaceae bacterium]